MNNTSSIDNKPENLMFIFKGPKYYNEFLIRKFSYKYNVFYIHFRVLWVLRDRPRPVTPCRRVGVTLSALFPTSSRLYLRVPSGCVFLFSSTAKLSPLPFPFFSFSQRTDLFLERKEKNIRISTQ